MKKVFLILGLLFWACLGYLAALNLHQSVAVKVLPHHAALGVGLYLLIAAVTVVAVLGSIFIANAFVTELKSKISKKERSLEKASVETEASSDKVKALEAKIKTLETALQQALKK